MSLSQLTNLGPASAAMLAAAGIHTQRQLEQAGPVQAFLAVRQAGATPSLNLLWAIAGALTETHWTALTPARKQQLRDELNILTADVDFPRT